MHVCSQYRFYRCFKDVLIVLQNCAIIGAGSAYPSGAPGFTPGFSGVRFLCSVLQIIVCRLVFFLLTIAFFVLLRFTDPDYPFGIFKLFLWHGIHIYPAISTFAVQTCYANKYLLYSYKTNKLFVLYEYTFQPMNKLSWYPVAMYSRGRRQI